MADHYHSGAEAADAHDLDEELRIWLDQFVHVWETADINALLSLLKEDVTISMPPIPSWYRGLDAIRGLGFKNVFTGELHTHWRLLPTRANGQPAFGLYRQAEAEGVYNAFAIQVLTFQRNLIADITIFGNPALFPYFAWPATLPV